MAETTGDDWQQIKAATRLGAGAKGQSCDGTFTLGNVPKYTSDGTQTDSGYAVSALVKKYATSWTSQTSVTVTHGLATMAVIVQVYDGSGVLVAPESITVTSSSVVTLTFGAAFTGSVVVLG